MIYRHRTQFFVPLLNDHIFSVPIQKNDVVYDPFSNILYTIFE